MCGYQVAWYHPFACRCQYLSFVSVLVDLLLGTLGHEDNDTVLSCSRELFGGGSLKTHDVAGILNDCSLHTQADTQVWELTLTSPLGNIDHTLNTSGSKASGDNDTLCADNVGPSLM